MSEEANLGGKSTENNDACYFGVWGPYTVIECFNTLILSSNYS